MESNLISALAWVSRGYASRVPKEYEIEADELDQIKQDPLVSKNLTRDLGKIQEQEEDDIDDNDMPVFCAEINQLRDNGEKMNDDYPMAFEDVSDEEREDYQIKPTDLLLVAAKIENEFSSLEVYVYEDEHANLYVHHEVQLSAFPLSIEWLSCQPGQIESQEKGNYAIVASFLPEIEIWNLDIVHVIEPSIILGGEEEQSSKKVKHFKKKQKKFKPGSHSDSVITLGLNKFKQNILCSGSADQTVKLWDINQEKCVYTYEHHTSKVQQTKWNLKEESILLTGAEDKTMCLFDVRTPTQIYKHKAVGNVESCCWDPIQPHNIVYSTEQGQIVLIDARKIDQQPLCQFKTSKKAVSSVSMSPTVPGLLAATNEEGFLQIYDATFINSNGSLQLVAQENPKFGQLYCGSFSQDAPWTVACGSSKGEIFVWDLQESEGIVEHFGNRVPEDERPNVQECTEKQGKPKKRKVKQQIEEEM